jgi:hypothetical protein
MRLAIGFKIPFRGSISKGKLQHLQNFTRAKALSRKGFGRSAVSIRAFVAKKK